MQPILQVCWACRESRPAAVLARLDDTHTIALCHQCATIHERRHAFVDVYKGRHAEVADAAGCDLDRRATSLANLD